MSDLVPGAAIGPYVIEDEIGRGGFATVYRANDARFGGPVAIKVLADHLAADDEAVEGFVTEARALRSVDNDSVVTVYDISATDDGRPFMVLQHADRGTLEERLRGRPAPDRELIALVRFLARALRALHDRQMVHRDVKPGNVLITSGPGGVERFVLGDLGLVKDLSAGPAITRGGGSAAYAAPEQRSVVSRVDARTDLYAASAVVAEAAIGRTRRPDESWGDVVRAVEANRPALAVELRRGLAEDPTRRPETAAAWQAALLATLDANADAGDPPGRRIGAAGAALAAIGVGVVAVVAWALWLGAGTDELPIDSAATSSAVTAATVPPATAPDETDNPAPCGEPDRGVVEGMAPAGLQVVDATDTTVTIEWESTNTPYSIFVGTSDLPRPKYFDNAARDATQYVIEGLPTDDAVNIIVRSHDSVSDEDGAWICARTLAASGSTPVGLTMATDLVASDITASSVTLSWTPAATGGRYLLHTGHFEDGNEFPQVRVPDGANVAAGTTSYVFEDLSPETEVVGLRTVADGNQSGLAWIRVDLPQG